MSPSSKETQRQTLLHLWNEGIRDASELHSRTHIPLSTIYYNINKLEKNGSVNHKRGNGRPRKITANVSRAISQYVRRDSSMSGKSIAAKLAETGVELHRTTITKHLVEIVERHLPEVNRMLGKKWRFQQDNDPKHTSRMAKNFFKENVPEIMDWPSNSPDLNPIENLWAIVKRETERCMPKNLNELERIMVEEWNAIPAAF